MPKSKSKTRSLSTRKTDLARLNECRPLSRSAADDRLFEVMDEVVTRHPEYFSAFMALQMAMSKYDRDAREEGVES